MKYVISLGGAILVPNSIDSSFIRKFVNLIKRQVKRGHSFFIVTGGGATARSYQAAAKKINVRISDEELDWIGISATRINAQLLYSAFNKTDQQNVKISSGWKPGRSTDFVAVKIAVANGIKTVLNLSDIDYVYDADPKTHKNARCLEDMTWVKYRKQFGSHWDPGAKVPFDPAAAKLAQKHGIIVKIADGRKLSNIENILSGKSFMGTSIGA